MRPEATQRIRRLELTARRVVEGFLSGMHRSPYFGQSVEFLQHRQYTAGDEIRHIDWKVYARQDRLHIKQYEEETNLRLHLLVDRSASMDYGQGAENKFEYAASLAACLAYLALRQQDATGLFTFDSEVRSSVPAKSNRHQLGRLLTALDEVGTGERTELPSVARQVAQAIPRRGLITVVSDLLGVDDLLEGLRVLRARGHDVALLHVLHDDELDFHFDGATRFEGLETPAFLNCNPRALREGYLEAMNEFLEQTRQACGRLMIDYLQVRTSEPLDAVLAKFLTARKGLPKLRG
ncbi:DUF58 domain-containing protein [Roseimaritima sediminicola]|uniref:DUF58 domain-containing protein n=1 Tax=Roseimaritima sediminicola TaxID=2662066 RepID=UPI0012982C3D|nr:DUF58 domain-containing protein [Roseimaritima sediminicola]